jgi:shikimate kinase
MRIYLIGYMGSGKTKTAEALAKFLKYSSADTDKLVEERIGSSIENIFRTEGQEYFRDVEKDVLRQTALFDKIVISTGGGTPCYYDNMTWMKENGLTVYLEANAGLLFHRLATNKAARPLISELNDVDLMEQITGHLAVRIPVYRKADIIFNAADVDVKELAVRIKDYKRS